MRLFKLNDVYSVVCESQDTRTGFRHVAVLLKNGEEIDRTKCTYQNRTWERFTFQTVLCDLIDKHFKDLEREAFLCGIND